MNTTQTLRQVMLSQLQKWDKGEAEEEDEGEGDRQEDPDADGEGWDTASVGGSSGDQEEEQGPKYFDEVGTGGDTLQEWGKTGKNRDAE